MTISAPNSNPKNTIKRIWDYKLEELSNELLSQIVESELQRFFKVIQFSNFEQSKLNPHEKKQITFSCGSISIEHNKQWWYRLEFSLENEDAETVLSTIHPSWDGPIYVEYSTWRRSSIYERDSLLSEHADPGYSGLRAEQVIYDFNSSKSGHCNCCHAIENSCFFDEEITQELIDEIHAFIMEAEILIIRHTKWWESQVSTTKSSVQQLI